MLNRANHRNIHHNHTQTHNHERRRNLYIPRFVITGPLHPFNKVRNAVCNQTRESVQGDAGPCWELNELMHDWYQVRKPACVELVCRGRIRIYPYRS